LKREYATTFATAGAVIVSYLLVFRIVASHLGTAGFGEYALARRTLSLLAPLALLGCDLAIARFVAYVGGDRSVRARSYVPAGLLLIALAVILLSSLLLTFQTFFSTLLFGSRRYIPLVAALPAVLTGTALHAVVYAYLRGSLRILAANLLMTLNQVLVPLAVVGLSNFAVPSILLAMGLSWIGISLVFLVSMPMSLTDLGGRLSELVRYGIPRVPGDFLQVALFSIPSILVAHVAGIAVAGMVAFGVAALGIVGSAVSPVNVILLPVAARLVAQNSIAQLRRQVFGTHRLSLAALVAGTIAVEIFAPTIVRFYLGPQFVPATGVLRVILIGAVPWGLYVTLRSVVDARHVSAINARNMFIAVVSFAVAAIILRAIWPSSMGVVAAFVVSLYILGALTIRQAYLIIRQRNEEPPVLVTNADIRSSHLD